MTKEDLERRKVEMTARAKDLLMKEYLDSDILARKVDAVHEEKCFTCVPELACSEHKERD